MRLATLVVDGRTCAARLDSDEYVLLDHPDVGAVLGAEGTADGTRTVSERDAVFAPLVTNPRHIFCVGLNYRAHILEMRREIPEYPTLFAKFGSALIGAFDDLVLPYESSHVDWEAELAVVVGRPLRRADEDEARAAIGGFTVANDVSMRDWQRRTTQWLQGKTFERTTPLGPVLVTPDEVDGATSLELRCDVDGTPRQVASTSDLLFAPDVLLSYISHVVTLQPGDVVLTGTPGGVGASGGGSDGLTAGQTLTTTIEGIGSCVNRCVAAP